MKIKLSQLRQIIREELEETDTYTFNMYTKDGKPRVVNAPGRNYEKARALAGSTFNAYFENPAKDNDPDTDNDGSLDAEELRGLADKLDKPAPAAKEKSYMQMSDEELITKVPVGQMRNRMGGPGRDLFKGVREGDPVPTPTEDLAFVMDEWESVRDIPGATLSIKRYPDNYKKMHRFDRGRPNMIWGDVDYPSLG